MRLITLSFIIQSLTQTALISNSAFQNRKYIVCVVGSQIIISNIGKGQEPLVERITYGEK